MNFARRMAVIVLAAGLVALLGAWFVYARIQAGINAAVDFKTAKRAEATIVSATGLSPRVAEVCFTIDDLREVRADLRQGYEQAEERRLAKNGPRCKKADNTAAVAKLQKGNKIEITYLLENEYQIDVVRMKTSGGEDADFR